MKRKALYIIFLFLFIVLYIVIRKPYYSNNLRGEEGNFADIFINQPPGPNYLLIARVNGMEIYDYPQHPALLYETIASAGRVAEKVINFSELSVYKTNVILRALFSSFQLVIWVLIWLTVVMFEYFQNKIHLFLLIGLLSLSPIALESSLFLQIDNTVGALFIGFFCFSLIASAFLKNRYVKYTILFFSGVVVGFGKNEWGIVLIASLFVSVIFSKLFSIKFQTAVIISILSGFAAGTVINIVFDGFNYFAGFKLMTGMLRGETTGLTLNLQQFIKSWVQQNIERLPYLSIIIILLLVNIIKAAFQFKKLFFEQILLLFFSSLLFFAFSVSSWVDSSRYFVPAFFTSIFTYILLTPNQKKSMFQIILFSTIIGIDIYFAPIIQPFKQIETYPEAGCLMDIGTARGFINTDVDFVTNSLGDKGQDNFALKYNTRVCER